MKLTPRQTRAAKALLARPLKREELDRVAGCSNSPDLIAGLRRKGLDIPCERIKVVDRDGHDCEAGQYSFTDADKQKAKAWLEVLP
jgi:hypothetical protein